MKKRFIISTLMVLFLATIALSQDFHGSWRWNKLIMRTPIHGVVVTPDNRIWINLYGNGGTSINSTVVILDPEGNEEARFSEVTGVDGVVYNLIEAFAGGRGMSVGGPDKQYVYHSSARNVYVIDHQTKQAVLKIVEPAPNTSATTACGDEFGNIIVSGVISPGPASLGVKMYGDDGTALGFAIPPSDDLPNISRDIAMTYNGQYIVVGASDLSPSGIGIGLWYCEDGTYGDGYTLLKEIGDYKRGLSGIAQDVHFDQYDRLWVGRDWDWVEAPPEDRYAAYECWDITKDPPVIVDAIYSPFPSETQAGNEQDFLNGGFNMPRGFWLSNDGTKAYVTDYNRGLHEYVKVEGQSDAKEPQAVPEGFALSQNYPNPFNPSTNFTYSIPNTADVRIAIYDLFGREINTLVNESKEAGTYTISWNGRDNQNRQVSTGVYFYKMQAAGFEKTMKMMLVK